MASSMRGVRLAALGAAIVVGCALHESAGAQSAPTPTSPAASAEAVDPLTALSFLEGTWTANATGAATAAGRYSFVRDLGRHVLARHSSTDRCSGPKDFDCEHGDLLYVYPEGPASSLKAIYLDSEGHVLHYAVSTPEPGVAIFLTEPGPGPRFRLLYTLHGTQLGGKFQMQAPGEDAWTSYLEWSGPKDRS